MIPKPKRKSSPKTRRLIREQSCFVHPGRKADCAHIRSRGAGGPDTVENMLPLCRMCHITSGAVGWHRFAYKYPEVLAELTRKGWVFTPQGKLKRAE